MLPRSLARLWLTASLAVAGTWAQAPPVVTPLNNPVTTGRQGPNSLTLRVGDGTPATLTAAALGKYSRHSVQVDEHGNSVAYEGVYLGDVLKNAGIPQGPELRGKAMATYLLATGADGYAVVFSLTECDPSFTSAPLLLADQSNGQPLKDGVGPFRLVALVDKKPARSVRMLAHLDVVALRK